MPKRVTSFYNRDMESYAKIGNLIFESPSNSIWTEAKSIAEEMSDIVSHTLLWNKDQPTLLHSTEPDLLVLLEIVRYVKKI